MYKVILVDDERWVRVVLRKAVEQTKLPFEIVQECANGLEAIDALQKHKADLVISDVKMPIMDGIALAEQMTQMLANLILVSGYDDFQLAQKAIRFGVKDYLLKPVEMEAMADCLGRWMQDRVTKTARRFVDSPLIGTDEMSAIEQVQQFIGSNLSRDISLTDAAALVHLNPSYLSQLFKQQTGGKFVDYVIEMRMEEAKKLLIITSLRVSEIAERLGYGDISYFSSTFKKLIGCSPLEYRKSGGRLDEAK
ncbi:MULTISPECIES: helix-turn-helix domain-containing protein [unclassified Paenibacillus]|uniref:response regulator transcription factor n=1 Tax=unclassified Paenibacillus TaxID=185978 RepID=UPI0027853A71|nr:MULTISPECIES: helix-turn-helix domain-containing protein [unclassified Paenibacillus]MDQ0900351.1 YesN/AraC family two-component response regulator [Paenibacillus sp. V4I7]MDQ0921140.1 YesN/AraC family two-component response regulator [Paenibacillus sp. V4I5]